MKNCFFIDIKYSISSKIISIDKLLFDWWPIVCDTHKGNETK